MIAASRLQLLLVLVVGALICFAVWRATTRFRALPRAAVRAFALALVLSPGFLVGHGAAMVPVVLLPLHVADASYLAVFGLVPLLLFWAVLFVVLAGITMIRSSGCRPGR
jgi:hypothetical protein